MIVLAMRTCRPGLLVLATLLGVAPAAHAHVGDQIYPYRKERQAKPSHRPSSPAHGKTRLSQKNHVFPSPAHTNYTHLHTIFSIL